MGNMGREYDPESFYMPKGDAAKIVTVTSNGTASAEVLVQTQARSGQGRWTQGDR